MIAFLVPIAFSAGCPFQHPNFLPFSCCPFSSTSDNTTRTFTLVLGEEPVNSPLKRLHEYSLSILNSSHHGNATDSTAAGASIALESKTMKTFHRYKAAFYFNATTSDLEANFKHKLDSYGVPACVSEKIVSKIECYEKSAQHVSDYKYHDGKGYGYYYAIYSKQLHNSSISIAGLITGFEYEVAPEIAGYDIQISHEHVAEDEWCLLSEPVKVLCKKKPVLKEKTLSTPMYAHASLSMDDHASMSRLLLKDTAREALLLGSD